MGLVGIRLTIFTLINFVAKSNCDRRGIIEGGVGNEVMCSLSLNIRLMLVGSYAHIVVMYHNSLEKILNVNY
ncbi:hypothetical protein Avbf_14226 [Armadillidium vulgare]|nr:hypothetical protein Avbf_14226 [Armadillidium vulgare]